MRGCAEVDEVLARQADLQGATLSGAGGGAPVSDSGVVRLSGSAAVAGEQGLGVVRERSAQVHQWRTFRCAAVLDSHFSV